ncbi:hypothetical protein AAMO2058_000652200 [Amorphochlora amoebiformis]
MAQQADLLGIGEDDDALVGVQPAELLSDDELEPVSDNKGFAPVWKVGMEVEVYSRSKDRWIAAIVRKIMSENGIDWVQVYYKNSTQMKDVRGDSDDIRMPLIDSGSSLPVHQDRDGKSSRRSHGKGFVSILHKVSTISKQVESGLYLLKRVASVVHRMAAAEHSHVASVQKILEQERQKVKDKVGDEMARCTEAWEATEELLANQLQKRSEMATKLEQKISVPLTQFYNDAELKRKIIIKDEKKYGVEMNRAKLGVQKNLRNCQKLINSCIAAKAEEEEKKKSPQGKKPKKKFGGIMSWAMNKMRGSLQELQNQAATAAKNYSHSIDYGNERQTQYFEKELPLICKQFEMLERSRINALHKYLVVLNSISKQHAEPLMQIISAHKKVVGSMDADSDIDEFTSHTVRMYGPIPPIEHYTYQLACTLKDIKAGRFEGNPNSYFYATLEHCMTMQEGKTTAQVPIIVPNLINAIRELGGYTQEGIFRLSAKKEDLLRLRAQFDSGNLEVKETSPHVPAGLLKQWLRELAEPLIPTEMYADAILIAKAKADIADVRDFIEKLPLINRKVLSSIGKMACEIAALSSINKMTFSNLAIVFAPGMLRNPSEDPAEMLENSKYESLFTKVLLESQK